MLCPECGEPFSSLSDIDWDHIGQRSLTSDDSIENGRPLHRGGCHKRKTAKDARDRAKTKRQAAAEENFRKRILARNMGFALDIPLGWDVPKPKRKIPSRPFPKRNQTK